MERIAPGVAFALLASLALFVHPGCQTPPPAATAVPSSESAPPGSGYQGEAFTFQPIAEGVYHAVGTGALAVGCNGTVVVNDEDVLLVDSHITPAAAWALMRELKAITDKPVRYVVNTHFHFDHVHGNQAFPPGVEIIGHEFTREKIASGGSTSGRAWDRFVGGLPAQIAEAESQLKQATDAGDEAKVKELQTAIAVQKRHQEATEAIVATPPTTTLSERMTLHRGGREIQLLFFGRGHTGGDVVVYLPREKVVATGDLLTGGLSYMGDGYLAEWADTLDEVKALDFEVVAPGHGQAFREKEKIDHFQAYLRDLWAKIQKMHADGVSAEQAAETIDMTNHAQNYLTITEPGVNSHAVARAYALLEGTER